MSVIRFCFGSLFLGIASLLVTTPQAGATGTVPQEDILRVTHTSGDGQGTRVFALSELRDIGVETITTSTIWTDGTYEFTGVPLHALLAHLGIDTGEIRAFALNDYSVTIPLSDARPGGPILAFEANGAPIPRRQKGPLWIIYPFDSAPEFRTEAVYSRSIWQLNRLVISE